MATLKLNENKVTGIEGHVNNRINQGKPSGVSDSFYKVLLNKTCRLVLVGQEKPATVVLRGVDQFSILVEYTNTSELALVYKSAIVSVVVSDRDEVEKEMAAMLNVDVPTRNKNEKKQTFKRKKVLNRS